MLLARPVSPSPDPVAAVPKGRIRGPTPSIAGPTDAVQLLTLQRLAGNRATSGLVVQRCGSISADQCPCSEDSGGHAPPEESGPGLAAQQPGPPAVPMQQLEV